MPFAKKRKIAETSDHSRDTQNKPATMIASGHEQEDDQIANATETPEKDTFSGEREPLKLDIAERDQEKRMERFRALQIRAVSRILINKSFLLKTRDVGFVDGLFFWARTNP